MELGLDVDVGQALVLGLFRVGDEDEGRERDALVAAQRQLGLQRQAQLDLVDARARRHARAGRAKSAPRARRPATEHRRPFPSSSCRPCRTRQSARSSCGCSCRWEGSRAPSCTPSRARAKSPLASSETARLLCARALLGSFATACSKRNAASRQRPFFATAVPKASCVDGFSVWEYDVHAPATTSKERAAMRSASSVSFAWRPGRYYRFPARISSRRIVDPGFHERYVNLSVDSVSRSAALSWARGRGSRRSGSGRRCARAGGVEALLASGEDELSSDLGSRHLARAVLRGPDDIETLPLGRLGRADGHPPRHAFDAEYPAAAPGDRRSAVPALRAREARAPAPAGRGDRGLAGRVALRARRGLAAGAASSRRPASTVVSGFARGVDAAGARGGPRRPGRDDRRARLRPGRRLPARAPEAEGAPGRRSPARLGIPAGQPSRVPRISRSATGSSPAFPRASSSSRLPGARARSSRRAWPTTSDATSSRFRARSFRRPRPGRTSCCATARSCAAAPRTCSPSSFPPSARRAWPPRFRPSRPRTCRRSPAGSSKRSAARSRSRPRSSRRSSTCPPRPCSPGSSSSRGRGDGGAGARRPVRGGETVRGEAGQLLLRPTAYCRRQTAARRSRNAPSVIGVQKPPVCAFLFM